MPRRLALPLALLLGIAVVMPIGAVPTATAATPSAGVRYLDRIFTDVIAVPDRLYATAASLTTGQPEPLLLDSYSAADDTETSRPAIVFIHGGGFRSGNKDDNAGVAAEYAQRGYATFSVAYRLDRTNRCQDIQQGKITDPAQLAVEVAKCTAAINAAQHDSQAAIRWIRANAASLGVDPGRIAAIGFSAGAVTAAHLAYRSNEPGGAGTVGDHLDQPSGVQSAIAASGCNYEQSSIGAGDAPMFFLHAEFDMPVPFPCAVTTADAARAAGLRVETMFYLGESTHARSLYNKYQADVDPRWTAFLFDTLDLGHRVLAGSQTVIRGLPNRSGIVSLVMTDNAAPGYVQVLPCGTSPGGSSNLNTDAAGQIRAGLAIVDFDADGEACLYNLAATHLVADLQGYLAPDAIDDVADVRLFDSRSGGGARLATGTRTRLTGRPASTAVVSLVADQTAAAGYLQVLPCDATPGSSSNLNADRAGQTVANLAFVQFDEAGQACVFNQTSTHLVVDLQAYLTTASFDDQPDVRALDTRTGGAPIGGSQTAVAGRAGSTAVVSLIATETTAAGYVQVLRCGSPAGGSSNLNADAVGQTIANLAVVDVDESGRFCLFNQTTTHLVADIQGYFADASFDDVPDVRLLDTRLDP